MKSIKDRRSIRKYKSRPVSDDQLHEILESARLAPSGSNTQPWKFIVVKSDERRQLLADQCHNQQWMAEAPVHIVCVADIRSRIKEGDIVLYEDSPEFELKQIIRDTSIAVEHMVLKAEDLGLSTCWIAWFEQDDIRPILNIPKDKFVLAVITIGYKDEEPNARPRKAMEDIIMYETWQ